MPSLFCLLLFSPSFHTAHSFLFSSSKLLYFQHSPSSHRFLSFSTNHLLLLAPLLSIFNHSALCFSYLIYLLCPASLYSIPYINYSLVSPSPFLPYLPLPFLNWPLLPSLPFSSPPFPFSPLPILTFLLLMLMSKLLSLVDQLLAIHGGWFNGSACVHGSSSRSVHLLVSLEILQNPLEMGKLRKTRSYGKSEILWTRCRIQTPQVCLRIVVSVMHSHSGDQGSNTAKAITQYVNLCSE